MPTGVENSKGIEAAAKSAALHFPVILWNKIPATRIEAIIIDSIDAIESPPK
ncbi:MAG: hypothetical protein WCN85_07670 [Burkholderiales bacterium]